MPYLLVMTAAVLWGIIGIFSKALVAFGFESTQIVFVRAFGAVIALFVYLLVKNPAGLKIRIRDSRYFVGSGIISFVFFNWCYFTAIELTSLSTAAVLMYTAPAIVMVLSVLLFKEKMTPKKLGSLLLTFIGCLLVSLFTPGATGRITGLGLLIGLGSGLGYALYSIFGRYALRRYEALTVTFYTFVFASLGLLPLTDLTGLWTLIQNPVVLAYAAGISLISTVLPFICYTLGLSALETGRAAIIATLEPIVATVVGILLFGEAVTLFKLVGIGLVVGAVVLLTDQGRQGTASTSD